MDEKKVILRLANDFNTLSELTAIHEAHRSEDNRIDGLSQELTGRLAQVKEYLKEMVKLTPRATLCYQLYTFSCYACVDGEDAASDKRKRLEVKYEAVKIIFDDRKA